MDGNVNVPERGRVWMAAAICLPIVFIGVTILVVAFTEDAQERGGPLSANPEWPLQLRYRVEDYDAGERDTAVVHEFRGRNWSHWTDIVISSSKRGNVSSFKSGVYTHGTLDNFPDNTSEYLPDSLYDKFPDNAHAIYTDKPGENISPGALFNSGHGVQIESSNVANRQEGATELIDEVLENVEIAESRLVSSVRIIGACNGSVDECQEAGQIVRRRIVFDKGTGIPMMVQEWIPSSEGQSFPGDGSRLEMEVIDITDGE